MNNAGTSPRESEETSHGTDVNSWISWYCSQFENHWYGEIDRAYIEDTFNLYGIKNYMKTDDYDYAMDVILDKGESSNNSKEELVPLLYGLIHARYILTTAGLDVMKEKYLNGDFGVCPRVFCRGQRTLPMGLSDEPGENGLLLFCPKCQDIFNPPIGAGFEDNIDGSYFGTTFPHLFCMTFEDLVPKRPENSYVPKVFGFRIHPSSLSNPKPVSRVKIEAISAESHDKSIVVEQSISPGNINPEVGEKRKLFQSKGDAGLPISDVEEPNVIDEISEKKSRQHRP